MNTEPAPRDDEIQFLASLPPSAGAIAIDGGDREGGRLKLDVPGTELASLLRLTMLRGRVLLVTVAPQQAILPLGPVMPDGEATAFPQNPLFQDPIGDQARITASIEFVSDPTLASLPSHVHRYLSDGVCVDCGEHRDDSEPKVAKPRKVRRGLIPKVRTRAKR